MKPTTTLPLAAAIILAALTFLAGPAGAAPLGPAVGPAAAERNVTKAHGCHWRTFRGWTGHRWGRKLHRHRGRHCRTVIVRRGGPRHWHAYQPRRHRDWHPYQPRRHRHFNYGCFWIGNVRVCN